MATKLLVVRAGVGAAAARVGAGAVRCRLRVAMEPKKSIKPVPVGSGFDIAVDPVFQWTALEFKISD